MKSSLMMSEASEGMGGARGCASEGDGGSLMILDVQLVIQSGDGDGREGA